MISVLIKDIKIIIENIYKKVYETYKDNLDEEGLDLFIASVRYYEIVIQELENKTSYEDPLIVEETLIKIKKDLKQILLEIV